MSTPTPTPKNPTLFTLTTSRTHTSDQKLLDALRTYHDLRKQPFTAAEFSAWPNRPATSATYVKRFGSWPNALTRAGIEATPYRFTEAQLIDTLEKVWQAAGRTPGKTALKRYGNISPIPYITRWGSLRRACTRLARYHQGLITRQELLTPDAAPKRKHLKPSTRWMIIARDNYQCTACGHPGHKSNRLEVDHILPISLGGTDSPKNLRTLCQRCNQGRGDARERKQAA